MKFLVDGNLPPALCVWLQRRGYHAQHIQDGPGLGASDRAILQFAKVHELVIFTKDEDFGALAIVAPTGVPIVWLRIGNATNAVLERWIEPLLPEILDRLAAGEEIIEVV
ncbi:MAG: DUF5615 family PIN-like protein [Planctomycetota bacterium]